jgi:hypothetical protein
MWMLDKLIAEALESQVVAPRIREIETHIRAEAQVAIDNLGRHSKEIRAELAAALSRDATRLRRDMQVQLQAFLGSADGKELLIGLLTEAISRSEVASLIKGVETRLNEVAAREVADRAAHAEIGLSKSSEHNRAKLQDEIDAFDRQVGEMTGKLIDKVFREAEEKLQEQRDRLIASSWDEIQQRNDDFIKLLLPRILRKAVERHIARGPRFVQPHSNRWLAAELGISVREVKRRRRRGEIPDPRYQSCY